jgi:nucleotide-binding universal stress UspA family protein
MNTRRILVPYDFSECSLAALDFAARFADADARIYVVHVDDLLDARISALPPLETVDIRDSWWDKRRRKIERQLAKIAVPANGAVYEHHWLVGLPSDQILAFAERVRADLIVMGSHGRTGLSRLITGSVAEEVMRQSKCPVVVVKPPLARIKSAGPVASEAPVLLVGNNYAI